MAPEITTRRAREEDGRNTSQAEVVEDEEADWDGPNDPDNPQNWSMTQRIYHTFVPVGITFVMCVSA